MYKLESHKIDIDLLLAMLLSCINTKRTSAKLNFQDFGANDSSCYCDMQLVISETKPPTTSCPVDTFDLGSNTTASKTSVMQ